MVASLTTFPTKPRARLTATPTGWRGHACRHGHGAPHPLDDEVPGPAGWRNGSRESIDRCPPDGASECPEHPPIWCRKPGRCSIVTCSGYQGRPLLAGRAASKVGLAASPRPFRAPPHLLATSSSNRSCRLRPDLIPRMSHLSARTASGCVAPADLIPRMFRLGCAYLTDRWSSRRDHAGPILPGNTTPTGHGHGLVSRKM